MSSEIHHLIALDLNVKSSSEIGKPKKKKKQTLVSVAKQAKKAGLEVARYDIDIDGKISVVTGKTGPQTTATSELDQWLEKRRAH